MMAKNELRFSLIPRFETVKSFYGKAEYFVNQDTQDVRLLSYGVHVAGIKDGEPYRVLDVKMSTTICRHIREFMLQKNFGRMDKKAIMALRAEEGKK